MYIFDISIFWYSIWLIQRKKFFHLIGPRCAFYELKVQNASSHSIFQYFVFYKQVLDFHRPFFIPDTWASKLLVSTAQCPPSVYVAKVWNIRRAVGDEVLRTAGRNLDFPLDLYSTSMVIAQPAGSFFNISGLRLAAHEIIWVTSSG